MNVLITGSTFWNPGDDVVRRGVKRLVRLASPDKDVNFFLHSFSHPNNVRTPCREQLNLVYQDEVGRMARAADIIVVPGLAVGEELSDFFRAVWDADCEGKLIFVGGMNENGYCAKHCGMGVMPELLKRARIVIGRTEKSPWQMGASKLGYHCLPCPSVCSEEVEFRTNVGQPRLYSIQVPDDYVHAVVNHSTGRGPATETLTAFKQERHDARMVCHHKSEFDYWRHYFGVVFKPQFQSELDDLRHVYLNSSGVVSTRLHAVLWAEAMGIPAVLVNDTDRHNHAVAEIPFVQRAHTAAEIAECSRKFDSLDWRNDHHVSVKQFVLNTEHAYINLLRQAL